MINLIGIHGLKQHGKDTVGDVFRQQFLKKYGELFEKKQLANKLKQAVCLIFGCTMEQLENEEFKNSHIPEEWRSYFIQYRDRTNKRFICETEREAVVHHLSIPMIVRHEYTVGSQLLTYRQVLQRLGTEGMRDVIHPKVHILSLFSEYKATQFTNLKPPYDVAEIYDVTEDIELSHGFLDTKYPNWIITDVRFENEIEAIKERGGKVVKVWRPSLSSSDKHESETSLPDSLFDDVIVNSGSLEYLKEQASLSLNLLLWM